MGEVALVSRFVLAGIFTAAGLGKLADRTGARQAVGDFGLPPALVGPLATALPLVELAVAVALIPGLTARAGAGAALVLLLTFSAVVAVNLARGRTPDCHCFGQAGSRPIGPGTLARNTAFAGLALVVLVGPAGTAGDWWSDLERGERSVVVTIAVLAALVALLGRVVLGLLRQQGRLLLRLDALEAAVGSVDAGDRPGLPVGAPAPSFALPDAWGRTLSLDGFLARERPVLLLFADPNCGPCNELFDDIGRWQREWREVLTIVVVSAGSVAANRAKAAEHGLSDLVIQKRREVATAYATTATPSAQVVGPDRRVASPLVAGGDAIWKLLLRAGGAGGGHGLPARAGALGQEIEITV